MSPVEDDLDVDLGGPPDSPTGLEISSFEATSVSLKWKIPEKDGGAPNKEYQIEFRKPADEEWSEGPKVKAAKFPNAVVNELTTNTKYEFRVRNPFGRQKDSICISRDQYYKTDFAVTQVP